MSYRIGSFNCLNFARTSTKDIQTFVDIILQERFDIVALQEIRGEAAMNRILCRLPKYWMGAADTESSEPDYAFIWNSRRMQLVQTPTPTGLRTYMPRIYKQYKLDRQSGQKELVRNPYFARFTPSGTLGGLPFEIRIINTHIRFSKSQSEYDDNSPSAIAMRKNEFRVLTQTIYPKAADKRYGDNMPAYTILLGDYNLNLRTASTAGPWLEEAISVSENGTVAKLIVTKQDELTTLKKPDKIEPGETESGFSSNYDHFTFDDIRFDSVHVSCKRIDTVQKYCGGDFKRHKSEVSDHVPICMNLNLKK